MTIPMAGSRPPLQPGETGPDFSLPLVTRAKLEALGIEGLGITEDSAEPVRSYYRMRPSKLRLATDPKRDVHHRYGLPMPFYAGAYTQLREATLSNRTGELPAPT